jgi:nicotinamidase-related amidase
MLARKNRAHLTIIDIQERLAPVVHGVEPLVANAARLVKYARRLDVPITFTEQMPERIGVTLPPLRQAAGADAVCLTKTTFSAYRTPAIAERFQKLRGEGRDQIVIAGMESHVCVLQTVLELLAADFEVLVVADAVSSRTPENRALAIERMTKAGAAIVSHEMIAFEWLERADRAEFKDLLPLFK